MAEISAEDQELLNKYEPLDNRIYELISELPVWDVPVIKRMFPNENDKAIYRALKRLETSGRIRCIGWHGRSKKYTTRGVSNLPVLTMDDGTKITIRDYFSNMERRYDSDGNWGYIIQMLNDLPVNIAMLFIIAELDDTELPAEYAAMLDRLVKQRTALNNLQSWIQALLDHPIFNGGLKTFKSTLLEDMPDRQTINEFKVWYSKNRKQIRGRYTDNET